MKEERFPAKFPRRNVLKSMAGLAVATALPLSLKAKEDPATFPKSINPRWYGFNLLEYFSTDADWMKYFPYKNDGIFREDDFRWMRDWGFNWVRLPMDYRFWTDPSDLMKIDEKKIEPIDRAIRLGEKYGIHVNICLHRAPGYCCLDGNDEAESGVRVTPEKTSLFYDQDTLDAFVHQWQYFAGRYAAISNEKLSFNLVNEPSVFKGKDLAADGVAQYVRVARAAIAGIRAKDPKRLIVTDGYNGPGWGHDPIPELFDAGIVQSAHDYWPVKLSHCGNGWARGPRPDQVPAWPLKDAHGKVVADKQAVVNEFHPWADLGNRGVPIHFGEMGCNRFTPANVVYAWVEDTLDMIASLNSGWGFWTFRGPYGVLDTARNGTNYKDWHGHQLDFTMLRLLQSKMKV